MQHGSINNERETAPLVNGGVYEYTHAGGQVEQGTIMGTMYDPTTGKTQGLLYSFSRGPVPFVVQEGTETMADWKLVSRPKRVEESAQKPKPKRTRRTKAEMQAARAAGA